MEQARDPVRQQKFRVWVGVTDPFFVTLGHCDSFNLYRSALPLCLFGSVPAMIDARFEQSRALFWDTSRVESAIKDSGTLSSWLWDITKSPKDFSSPWNQRLLKIYLSHRKDIFRCPLTYVLYELLKKRKINASLRVIRHFRSTANAVSDGVVRWSHFFDGPLRSLCQEEGLFSSPDLVEAFKVHKWGSPDDRDLNMREFQLDDFRDETHNLVSCFHAAASSCRRTSKYKSLAGVQDSIVSAIATGPQDQDSAMGNETELALIDGICPGVRLMKALAEDMGCDCTALDKDGLNALFYSAVSGCVKCMEWLYDQGCPINSLDNQRRSAFYCAACVGELEPCRWLVNHGYNFQSDASVLKRTALCKATWGDFPDIVE
eukprot:Gregarina_sp_Poly_1__9786@NODE_624_length_7087_cov_45_976353_g478_i0_p2_GENE_NODE_624_length_7087_cov_45_976353_g478_i0NODE_624_length_7087_cov_45_976353_g478_i0_p2_ORF_typecomplete_len375_score46_84Ank_2/PF12796_7/2_4e10Ank_2/PF12796_7/5_3e03Ank_4/PF13637_6/4_9e03Ank_4/PF13637_6/5_5e03Ank_4/PF13637_6/0_023Ank_4/PF13637_6/4_7e06Ank_4/PF13637_6/15Ank_5/PF13857_6/2_8e05Ank_5/PF13857_6/2e02Ank_5/PF13857_6/1_7e02_NODE_624_length_7087_cov_45_976353_g478_i042945418